MAHILLIEPNKLLAKTYSVALHHVGHKVVVVDNAQSAIDAADRRCPDVILLELQLASHNGIEFLYELRSYREWQAVPVIVHSLVPPTEFAVNPVLWGDLGVNAYLYKPRTTLMQLLRALSLYLSPASSSI